MCMSIRPGIPSGPAAVWLGVWRKTSCIMDGLMHPKIIGILCCWLGVTWQSHGNGASCESVWSGERAWVSCFCTCAMTSSGSVMRGPEASSLMIARFVGSGLESFFSVADRRIDCKATFGFGINIRRRNFPYFSLRWLRACFRSRRVVRRCALIKALRRLWRSDAGVGSSFSSGMWDRLRASKFWIGGGGYRLEG